MNDAQALVIAIAVAWVLVSAIPSLIVAQYADNRGHPFWPLVIAGLFVGWPLVLLIAAVTSDRSPLARAAAASQAEYND